MWRRDPSLSPSLSFLRGCLTHAQTVCAGPLTGTGSDKASISGMASRGRWGRGGALTSGEEVGDGCWRGWEGSTEPED